MCLVFHTIVIGIVEIARIALDQGHSTDLDRSHVVNYSFANVAAGTAIIDNKPSITFLWTSGSPSVTI